jgi:hypothetical protein
MTLSEVKTQLKDLETLKFQLPNGKFVPSHFHVTEVGKVTKHFIDCGGTVREEQFASMQLWNANDYDHRLHSEKLTKIIELSERTLGLEDFEVEVEYQGDTIQRFGLDFNGESFLLTTKHTDCLAKDNCGIPPEKMKVSLSELQRNGCAPGSGCC